MVLSWQRRIAISIKKVFNMGKIILVVLGTILSSALAAEEVFVSPYTDYHFDCGTGGGKLILPTTSDPKSFNPIVAQETSTTTITSLIFEGLTYTDPRNYKVMPSLAQSWQSSEDGRVWVFNLRRDVYWNDGVKFTAEDVVFTFNDIIYNENIPTSARDIFTIDGKKIKVEALDKYQVKFTLPFTFAPFLRSLSQEILPKHKYEKLVKEGKFSFSLGLDTNPEDIVGSGPFRLKIYRPGEMVILERNPFYWKKDTCSQKLPYLDKIVYIIIPNLDTALLKFLDKELDYYPLRPQDLAILSPLRKRDNFTIYNAGVAFGSSFLVLNQNYKKKGYSYKRRIFRNKKFRQAIAYLINRKKIISIVFNELAKPQFSPVSPANKAFYNPNIKKYSYNPQKAKQLLKEISLQDRDKDGILEDEQGHALEITFFTNANNQQRVKIATLIKKDLEAAGIKVHFLPLDFNLLVNKLNTSSDWELVLIGLTGGIEPYFGKNVWSYKGSLHIWNTSKKPIADYEVKIEEIFNKSAKILDQQKRKRLFYLWQDIASRELPFIYTVAPYTLYAVRNKFGNLYPTVLGGAFSQIEYVYIKKEK